MKTKSAIIFVLVLILALMGCGQAPSPEATMTPTQRSTPTPLPEPTHTTVPTVPPAPTQHTPDPAAVKLVEEAFSFSKQGEDEKAIEAYTKAIEFDPYYGQPYINRGSIYADRRELEKALADFNRGLELDPTNPLGYSNRAQVYFELEKLDEALNDIQSLLSVTKDDQYVIYALTIGGHIYDTQEKPYHAVAAYTAALEMNDQFEPALISRGQIYFNQKDWLRAFSDLGFVLNTTENPEIRDAIVNILTEVYPEGTTVDQAMAASKVHFDEGMAFRENSDYASSTESLSKAIEIDPLNADFYFFRGLNYAADGKLDDGITDMSFTIALLPYDPRGYYFRGLMEADLGLAAEAIRDMEKTLEFDLNADTKVNADQVLKNMRQLYKSCQFTAFKTVNDEDIPTFEFAFIGPPNTEFLLAALSRVEGGGSAMAGITAKDGVTTSTAQYQLGEDETTPIELDIKIRTGECQLSKTAIWPEIDVLALLSGAKP